ncbi:Ferric reduction oxidase 2 [Linum perenne]
MIWVMLPTKVYKNSWKPSLTSTKFNSSYFEDQGTNLVLFTLPVMLIAALGSIYLHFQTKKQPLIKSSSGGSQQAINPWTRVLLISPLGTVTVTELAFVTMFVALHIWSLANYLYVSFGDLHNHDGVPIWQAKFRSVSLRLGYIGNISWAFLFFPITRGSSLLPILGLTSESSIKYHIWLGHFSNVLFTLHTLGFIIYWAMTNQMSEMLDWSRSWVSNVAGEIAMVIAAVMWIASSARVRRKAFEVFFYSHHLYLVYVIFYLLHVGAAYGLMILPGIFLFAIDRCLRFLQSQSKARLVSTRVLPGCETLELTFAKCPDRLEISVEGPYGPISSHFLRHEVLVLISGGSGITPFISIIREFIFQTTSSNPNLESRTRVLLISAFKSSADLAILDLIFPVDGSLEHFPKLNLQIEAYITRESNQVTMAHNHSIQTKRFNPTPSDSPITGTLGPDAWLWLAGIIASSFAMFIVLLAIVTRVYIYPIDGGALEGAYHFSYFVLWDVFLTCGSIFVACSMVFFVKKKKNRSSGDRNKIKDVEMEAATETVVAEEVESGPGQWIGGATKVHFGRRPDLKGKRLVPCIDFHLRRRVKE